MKPYMIN